jgi:ADP-heptose:LPS heptosyltransferase
MTAAIESLHRLYPGRYRTAVESPCPALYEHNPLIEDPGRLKNARRIDMGYPLVNLSNQRPVHFLEGYCEFLGGELGIPLPCQVNRPILHLSAEEQSWWPQVAEIAGKRINYWVVNAGTKKDFTAKGWGRHNYQAVVDALYGRIQFVQIGEAGHRHEPLRGVINLVGKTDLRQLVRLCFHAQGGLGPSTLLQHLCAALEKPYVCLLGGREPVAWTSYPQQITLHTIGQLSCCAGKACWKSRTVKLGDGDPKDDSLCEQPVLEPEPVPRCLALIRPEQVVRAIEAYYVGGRCTF